MEVIVKSAGSYIGSTKGSSCLTTIKIMTDPQKTTFDPVPEI